MSRASHPGCLGVLHLRSSRGMYGAERAILDLAATCRGLDVSCGIATLLDRREPHHELADAARALDVPVWELPSRGRFDLRPLRGLLELCRRLRPQLLHAHGYKAQTLAWLLRTVRPIPLVVTHHGDTGEGPAVELYEALGRLLLRQADRVIAVSGEATQQLRQALTDGPPVLQIPNGVDAAGIAARVRAAGDPLPLHGLGVSEPVLLAVGRLSPEKGHRTLIEALGRLPQPRPTLVIAGEGPLRQELSEAAARHAVRLLLPGFVPDLAPWWRVAQALVQPSQREGLPLAVLEAMAAGLPIVASAVGEIPGVLGRSERAATHGPAPWAAPAGLLVPPDEVAPLVEALGTLLGRGGPARRRAIGARARALATEHHGLAAIARRTIEQAYWPLAPGLRNGHDAGIEKDTRPVSITLPA